MFGEHSTYKIIALGFLLFITAPALALTLTQTGSWSFTLTDLDLLNGAGGNLPSYQESSSNEITLAISGTVDSSDSWRLDVRKSDTTWNQALDLQLKRTSNGTGSGSINGGTSYLSLTDSSQELFSGAGDRDGVDIQLKIAGISVSLPENTYSTTVIYTLVDI